MVKSRAFPVFAVIILILSATLESSAYPAIELKYDDGEPDTYYDFTRGVVYAVEFTPPSLPWVLTAIRVYLDAWGNGVLRIEVWDPNLRTYFVYRAELFLQQNIWLTVDIPDLMINFTPFFIVIQLEKEGAIHPYMRVDTDAPAGRSYLAGIVGGNILYEKLRGNLMIRAVGTSLDAYAGEPLTPVVLGNMREELSSISTKVSSLERGLSNVTVRIDRLERDLSSGVSNIERRVSNIERDVSALKNEFSSLISRMRLEYFPVALALLALLTLISLTVAVRASRRASRLEDQLRLLEGRLRSAELAPRRVEAQVEEVGRARVEAPKLGAGAGVPGISGWVVVIDGSNVAYAARDSLGRPRARNILLAVNWAREKGYTPLVVVDASLKHHIDDPFTLDSLRARGVLYEAPARTSADAFIISIAEKQGALILSNDTFKEYLGEKPWIEKRRLAFMIVGDEIFVVPPSEREQKGGEEKR
ncbi:MAG: hypothetical protein QXO64_02285 [Thermofilaceae archaeon]